ncbi:thiamine pyrophosphate-dependent enzyme [Desulfovibrio mangrovi]|uniref:thiamine pyrophosphate-dependent enzyme n=1 Tax=Desulfovibrio mangrovi TaxID=2976983 RepID=UPI002246E254|nr:thiamine pyrophosphate-dependent enzyme [Desulfovibrio mangrovi]UZP68513.1 thiamine pyrophosphate-dependent enzyme [Desulfovibrio mangrovi]
MLDISIYGDYHTSWCPGCGNHDVLKALKEALAGLDLAPHQVVHVSGIGQAAKAPHYITLNGFNGLHGRCLPPAQAVKLANPSLTVIAESGDGCNYGEGGNHFLAAIRRNVNITLLVHDNQIYGLTKGQASPTTSEGHVTKSQPDGVTNASFNPIAVAVAMRAGFVARAFSGNISHLATMMQEAIRYPGFAMVDILSPCISFNKVNTFGWYKQRCYELGPDHDPGNWDAAMAKANEFGEHIPVGIIWRNNERMALDERVAVCKQGPLGRQSVDMAVLAGIMQSYI